MPISPNENSKLSLQHPIIQAGMHYAGIAAMLAVA